jgi:hypothetical protein
MTDVYALLRGALEWLGHQGLLPAAIFFQFVANAVIAGLIIGPLLGVLGTMVVVKRMAFFSQAIGNAALTGVSIGILLGEAHTSPYVSTFAFCIIFGLLLRYAQQRTSLSNDVLIGVFSLSFVSCFLSFSFDAVFAPRCERAVMNVVEHLLLQRRQHRSRHYLDRVRNYSTFMVLSLRLFIMQEVIGIKLTITTKTFFIKHI